MPKAGFILPPARAPRAQFFRTHLATETPPQPAPASSGSDGEPPRRPPYSIYDTRGQKRRRPRWVRIALWTGGSLHALILVVTAVVGWWVHGLVD